MTASENRELARAEAEVTAHSDTLKKVLGVKDLALTQILFIVGLTWIGVAGSDRRGGRCGKSLRLSAGQGQQATAH